PRSRRSPRALRALPQLRLGSRGSRVTAPPGYGAVAVTPHFRCTTCQRPETAWGVQCVGCFALNTLRPIALTGPGGTADAMDADMATPQSHKTRQAIPVVLAPSFPGTQTRIEIAPPIPAPPILPLQSMPLSAARIAQATAPRVATGISEFDRVLGGGIVDGALVLLGGDAGLGKSTLLMQIVHALVRHPDKDGALYASGEESMQQIALRAERLGIENDHIQLVASDDIDRVIALAAEVAPSVLVIDSVQTMFAHDVDSAVGSAVQVVEVVRRANTFAKTTGTPVVI